MPMHSCVHCGQPIESSEAWEYYDGAPRLGAAETARRVHCRCSAVLLRDALTALAEQVERE